MANLRVLDPYAPYLDVVVLLFLGYAHVQNYREKRRWPVVRVRWLDDWAVGNPLFYGRVPFWLLSFWHCRMCCPAC
ncbi:hypothetical protein [Acidithiobacillus thiooxidans]|uniref:hypothetical protein n=1 Tax=Acidithiobacillus thiooxidans TaxID=930 RepID=UPI001D00D03C|nr:hypothetical protein [Acidithiobacillus thiooxidans]